MPTGRTTLKSSRTSTTRKAMPPAVLVTGASGSIGRAICLAFAQAGWFVGVHYNLKKPEAEKTLRLVEKEGRSGGLFQADIRSRQSVEQMVAAYCRHDVVPRAFVCNAGATVGQLLVRHRETDWADVIETNLTGTFHCLQAMAPPLLAEGGGSIVVIGSHAGFHGQLGQAAYATSKAGLIGLVKTAAQEWGPQNVRVNLLLPGWQKTGLSKGAMPESGWHDHALRRSPSMEEVARTVVHLAQLQHLSGQVWNCDSRHL